MITKVLTNLSYDELLIINDNIIIHNRQCKSCVCSRKAPGICCNCIHENKSIQIYPLVQNTLTDEWGLILYMPENNIIPIKYGPILKEYIDTLITVVPGDGWAD